MTSTPPAIRSTAPHRTGFTLVELLVTILVVIVAAGLVLPTLGTNEAGRLRGAARLLAADLNYAQVQSLAHGDDPCLVAFDADGKGYHVAADSDPNTALTNPATRTPYVVAFGQGRARSLTGVGIKDVDSTETDRIAFGVYGQLTPATSQPAAVTLTGGKLQTTLTIDPTTGEVTRGDIVAATP